MALWPGGIVPYAISAEFDTAPRALYRDTIRQAANAWTIATGGVVQFVECRDPDATTSVSWMAPLMVPWGTWIRVAPDGQDKSNARPIGASLDFGPSTVNLRSGLTEAPFTAATETFLAAVVVHELGHVLGLHHTYLRPDRDRWVRNRFRSILVNRLKGNAKVAAVPANTNYDYQSIMGTFKWCSASFNPPEDPDYYDLSANVVAWGRYCSAPTAPGVATLGPTTPTAEDASNVTQRYFHERNRGHGYDDSRSRRLGPVPPVPWTPTAGARVVMGQRRHRATPGAGSGPAHRRSPRRPRHVLGRANSVVRQSQPGGVEAGAGRRGHVVGDTRRPS